MRVSEFERPGHIQFDAENRMIILKDKKYGKNHQEAVFYNMEGEVLHKVDLPNNPEGLQLLSYENDLLVFSLRDKDYTTQTLYVSETK